jgi:general secretion pathway protein G
MKAKGFTLVEILIVVVILGILAAIVIPQFTGASTEAKESSLKSDLQAIRSQIELFRIQHNAEILPGETVNASGSIVTITSADEVVNALCYRTDKNGVPDTTGTGLATTYKYGPYMNKLPENPFSAVDDTVVVVADKSEGPSSLAIGTTKLAGAGTTGWYFVYEGADKGLFQAADGLKNPDQTEFHYEY